MTMMSGGCHCKNIKVEYESDVAPADTKPRACQCSFCRQHQTRAVSDPKGALRISVADGEQLNRYQFGMRSIDFLICRQCGVYVAAFMADPTDDNAFGTLMISALDQRKEFPAPTASVYDDQSKEERAERRRNVWTPATLMIDA